MDIVEIGSQLSQLEYALVHGGPRHPKYPNPGFQSQINQVFDEYPKLTKDKTYVDFLETYVGAMILYPDSSIDVSIYGVWDYTLHLLEDDLVENSKFLCFSAILLGSPTENNMTSVGFAFDISNDELGVYRRANYRDETAELGIRREPYQPYCVTFLEWLERIVESKGKLID